ncbi:MAG: hypothetical protein DRP87_15515 [Spirochaetes bacterium]|nr:MAG: hypothetical protein DRP87_15515 [Spirochaetota bacterium]
MQSNYTAASEGRKPFQVKTFILISSVVWTILLLLTLSISLYVQKRESLKIALGQARPAYLRDVIYRKWSASHGGTYVETGEDLQPNPYPYKSG